MYFSTAPLHLCRVGTPDLCSDVCSGSAQSSDWLLQTLAQLSRPVVSSGSLSRWNIPLGLVKLLHSAVLQAWPVSLSQLLKKSSAVLVSSRQEENLVSSSETYGGFFLLKKNLDLWSWSDGWPSGSSQILQISAIHFSTTTLTPLLDSSWYGLEVLLGKEPGRCRCFCSISLFQKTWTIHLKNKQTTEKKNTHKAMVCIYLTK